MTRPKLSTRDRRTIALGVAVVAFLLGASRAIPAYRGWEVELRETRFETEHELADDRELVGNERAVRESTIVRGRRVIALAPAILPGETANSAGASLAGVISGAAAQAGAKLGAVQLRSDSLSRGAFTRIGAHVEATGDIRGITKMLAALERGPTLIAIRAFSIEQREPAAGDDRVEALHVQLDVEGIMLNPRATK